MNKPELCLDYYRETLKVGDFVVPIYEEAQKAGIHGTITKIEYIPEQQKHYLTLQDENGNTFDRIWYSRCFSTPERQEVRNNKKYVYSLVCYNNKFKRIGRLPLTNIADSNYSIPDNTCYITLDAEHLEERPRQTKKANILGCTSYMSLYYFIIKDKLELADVEHRNGPVLISKENIFPQPISHDYMLFDSKEDLQECIEDLILHFNKADLTNINNEKEFRKNKQGQDFEDDLVLKLKMEV